MEGKLKKIYAGKHSFVFKNVFDYLYHDVPTMSLAMAHYTYYEVLKQVSAKMSIKIAVSFCFSW